jgi:hypothetical protein
MKAFVFIGAVIAIAMVIFASRDIGPIGRLPVSIPLPEGRTNPPLKRIADTWPIPTGTEVWGYTNHTPIGKIEQCEERHDFERGPGDGFAIRYNNATNEILWVPRRTAKKLWIPAEAK